MKNNLLKKSIKFLTLTMLSIAVLFGAVSINMPLKNVVAVAEENGVDLAFSRRAVASGKESDSHPEKNALDGNSETRWASNHSDNAWFYVDLGSVEKFNKIVIDWETCYGKKYEISVSGDAINWYKVAEVENKEKPDKDVIKFPYYLEGQFVKFTGIERAVNPGDNKKYGYSFFSFEVYGPKSLAEGSEVAVSSFENQEVLKASYITDNIASTRWASAVSDNQWVIIDMKDSKTFDKIKIRWEVSFARSFEIYASLNAFSEENQGKLIFKTDAGLGEVDDINLKSSYNIYNNQQPVTARYLKINLIQREVHESIKKTGRFPWESTFSIYSFEVFSWDEIHGIPVGSSLQFSENSRAWGAMSNITLYDGGLIMAAKGYPNVASDEKIDKGIMDGFESYAVYNPAVIYDDKNQIFHMVYRSELPDNFGGYFMHNGGKNKWGHVSTLSYAWSKDGVNYTRGENNPIAKPTIAEERGGGLEDPRIFRIRGNGENGEDTYYVTYTMYDNNITREGMIYTTDFKTWTKVGRLAPDYDSAYKSGTYVTNPDGDAIKIEDPRPGKVGKVYMIYMKDGAYTKVGFTKDVTKIEKDDIIDIGPSGFSSLSIEAMVGGNESCMALTNIYGEDDDNIYLMYGGNLRGGVETSPERPNVTGGWFYALGVVKATKSNPFELMNGELDIIEPYLYPTDTNKINYGLFDKCMFADTMIRKDDMWYFYYGAGDMYVGLATSNGSLTANSPHFTKKGNNINILSNVMNKKYNDDFTSEKVTFKVEVYSPDGVKNDSLSFERDVDVEHFSMTEMGEYYSGKEVELTVDTSSLDNYYITVYAVDKNGKLISVPGTYVNVSGYVEGR